MDNRKNQLHGLQEISFFRLHTKRFTKIWWTSLLINIQSVHHPLNITKRVILPLMPHRSLILFSSRRHFHNIFRYMFVLSCNVFRFIHIHNRKHALYPRTRVFVKHSCLWKIDEQCTWSTNRPYPHQWEHDTSQQGLNDEEVNETDRILKWFPFKVVSRRYNRSRFFETFVFSDLFYRSKWKIKGEYCSSFFIGVIQRKRKSPVV